MSDDPSGTQEAHPLQPSAMSKAQFVATFGGIYEHSPWVARAALARGLDADADSPEGLARVLAGIVDEAPADKKLALLRSHPDLAGRLALAGEMTAASVSEQASAGLDQCTAEELSRFQELNTAYTHKFGFPFIVAVRGRNRGEILELFKQRLGNTPQEEFAEALKQVHRIAALRVRDQFEGRQG